MGNDELGFQVLEAIRGDRVRINGNLEFEVTSSAHLRAKSDDGKPEHADLYGFYASGDRQGEYRITVKPDISGSGDYIDEIEIWRVAPPRTTLQGGVESFEFIERADGERVPRSRYEEIWAEEREEKRG